ncbi:unnamed protein product [Sphenostylis stenocarpa]|uniref:Uncharacterized protein n=1 Tax=Sphenostylis stenocarpa TaxID=92480 RepID=A0AA86W4K0_9FABA|nr:unnamed protein product [Sphenostylis stenocarpa]
MAAQRDNPSPPPTQTDDQVPTNFNGKIQLTASDPHKSPPSPGTQTQNELEDFDVETQKIQSDDPHTPPAPPPNQTQKNGSSHSDIEVQMTEESSSNLLEMVTSSNNDTVLHVEL